MQNWPSKFHILSFQSSKFQVLLIQFSISLLLSANIYQLILFF